MQNNLINLLGRKDSCSNFVSDLVETGAVNTQVAQLQTRAVTTTFKDASQIRRVHTQLDSGSGVFFKPVDGCCSSFIKKSTNKEDIWFGSAPSIMQPCFEHTREIRTFFRVSPKDRSLKLSRHVCDKKNAAKNPPEAEEALQTAWVVLTKAIDYLQWQENDTGGDFVVSVDYLWGKYLVLLEINVEEPNSKCECQGKIGLIECIPGLRYVRPFTKPWKQKYWTGKKSSGGGDVINSRIYDS